MKHMVVKALAGWLSFACVLSLRAASVVYVDAAAAAGGDGTSWAKAFASPSEAVAAVENDGTIYFKGGTYLLDATIDLSGKTGVALMGGYSGDGAPGTRDVKLYRTTLDGQSARRVIKAWNAERTTIDGLVIANGCHDQSDTYYTRSRTTASNTKTFCGGSGISFHESADCVVRDCEFIGNSASATKSREGAAIAAFWGALTVENCLFATNGIKIVATDYGYRLRGGAVTLGGLGDKIFRNCVFHHNTLQGVGANAHVWGGAIYNLGEVYALSPMTISNCLFYANQCRAEKDDHQTCPTGHAICGSDITVWASTFAGHPGDAWGWDNSTYRSFVAYDSVFVGNGIDLNPVIVQDCTFASTTKSLTRCLVGKLLHESKFTLTDCAIDVDENFDYEPGFVLPATSPIKNIGYMHPEGTVLPTWKDLYVDPTVAVSGTGAEASPFKTVTEALAAATDWTRIHLAAGTYSAASNGETFPLAVTDRIGIKLIGTAPQATIFDGGSVSTDGLRVFSVVRSFLVSIENVRLQNVWASSTVKYYCFGCGLYTELASLKLKQVSVADNRACHTGSVTRRVGRGAGVAIYNSAVTAYDFNIDNCRFFGGALWQTGYQGAGIYACHSAVAVERAKIIGNGIDPTANCRSDDESANAQSWGGGVLANAATMLLRNSLIVSNDMRIVTSTGSGPYRSRKGAAVCALVSGYSTCPFVRMDNCTIDGNYGTNAIYTAFANKAAPGEAILNNTFVGSPAGVEAFGYTVFTNKGVVTATTPAVDHSAFDREYTGVTLGENGNFKLTKTMAETFKGAGDYRLVTGSELINAGANLYWMTSGATDLAGNPRVTRKTSDIGCYESPASGMVITFR